MPTPNELDDFGATESVSWANRAVGVTFAEISRSNGIQADEVVLSSAS